MEFRVLGQLEVLRDGAPLDLGTFKQRALLALLLIHRNRVLAVDRIIDELWGEEGSPDRKSTLHVYLSNLRRVLEPDRAPRTEGTLLLTRPPGYVLQVDPDQTDVDRFEAMVAEGRRMAETDPAGASIVLGEALALWRGRAYEEFTYEQFAEVEVARLSELRLEAVEARIDADLARGLNRELIGELEGLVAEHPLRERFCAQLMLALYRSGRQAEALRAYRELASRLGSELGIEPSDSLRSLEERIVTADRMLLQPGPVSFPGDSGGSGLAIRGYELRSEIGTGQLGMVYRAFQPSIAREVAVTVIHPELADDPTFIRRFEEEAGRIAQLDHPHVLPLYDYWREPGAGYLVTRYIPGGTLLERMEAGPLAPEEVAELVQAVGSALAAVHAEGIAHGSITPRRILMGSDGAPYLAGLGVAQALAGNGGPVPADGHYAAPEVRDGETPTPRSDVYSLAVIAAECLAGHPVEPPEIGVDDPAGAVLAQATDADPTSRFPDAETFSRALLDTLDAGPRRLDHEPENPYKGLRAFRQSDAADFFGRERLVERLVGRLARPGVGGRFVAVVGPSGSGKSSAVRAGLLPALRRDAAPGSSGWYLVEMTPGSHPFTELEQALAGVAVRSRPSLVEDIEAGAVGMARTIDRVLPDDHSQLLVVIDQLEELFTLTDPAVADRFLDAVAETVTSSATRVRFVVTLRADFYDRPLSHRRFGELLRHGTELVTPMSPEELERAITGPAERVGVRIEAAVVAEMIAEVGDRAGALPLLQYALTELFEHREGGAITHAAYRSVGGVTGALGERAERLLESLRPDGRAAARQVMLRLVSLKEGGGETRRRVLLTELERIPLPRRALDAALDAFGRARLISFDRDPVTRGPTVEISHEALLTEWLRLRRWIDEARSDLRQQRALHDAAREWIDSGRDPDLLMSEGRLARYEEWETTSIVRLEDIEREYLAASRERRDAEAARAEAQRQRELALERQARRRLRMGVLILAVGLAVTALLWATAARQRRAAQEHLAALVAERLPDASLQARTEDPQLALLLAGEALVAAHRADEPLDRSVVALHLALQEVNARFPTDAEVKVVSAPEGRRGVFLLPLGDLLRMRDQHLTRGLTAVECTAHLGISCPETTVESRLPSAILSDSVLERETQDLRLEGTELELGIVFPARRTRIPGHEYRAGYFIELWPSFWRAEADTIRGFLGLGTDSTLVVPGAKGIEMGSFGEVKPDVAAFPAQLRGRVSFEVELLPLEGIVAPQGETGMVPPALVASAHPDGTYSALWASYDPTSVVWYRTDVLDSLGLTEPQSWGEMIALSDALAEAGHTPWCLGLIGQVGGVPLLALIQSQVLAIGGVDLFDAWVRHEIPADDPRILAAHRRVGTLVLDEGVVHQPLRSGGNQAEPLLSPEPDCVLWPAPPSWVIPPSRSRANPAPLGVFALPTGSEVPALAVTGDLVAMLRDRPEARAFMGAVIRPDFGMAQATRDVGVGIAANLRLPPSSYVDPNLVDLATVVRDAGRRDQIRMDLITHTPDLAEPYRQALVRWFEEGPEALPEALADLEEEWSAIEAGG